MGRRFHSVRHSLCLAACLAAALPALASEEGARPRGRLQLEIAGSVGWSSPGNLNGLARSDRDARRFLYDARLEYLHHRGELISWDREVRGEPRDVRLLLSPGIRLRYRMKGGLVLMGGLHHLRGGKAATLESVYTSSVDWGAEYVETLAHSPYELSVSSWWPNLGVEWGTSERRLARFSVFAAAGPIFSSCAFRSAWTTSWVIRNAGETWPMYTATGRREETGSGSGLGLETGARIHARLSRRLGLFLEGAYARQVVRSISGSGFAEQEGQREEWSGEWGMCSETMTASWGALTVRYPTGRRSAGAGIAPFRLDLSGLRLRVGVCLDL